MKNHILTYNQLNESIDQIEDLSFDETGRLLDLGLIDNYDILKIYEYVRLKPIDTLLVLKNSKLKNLPTWLTEVNGDLILSNSNIEKIPNSLIVTGDIVAPDSMLNTIEILISHGSLWLDNCKITKLPNNLKVNGFLSVENIIFEEFPTNLKINGNLFIAGSNLEKFSDEELYKMYDIQYKIIHKSNSVVNFPLLNNMC